MDQNGKDNICRANLCQLDTYGQTDKFYYSSIAETTSAYVPAHHFLKENLAE